jgi:hypothetical protein
VRLVDRTEVLRLGDYEAIRPQFRARIISEKKQRRFAIGERISGVFETHDSVLMQIQEMLRTERITREAAIDHEIETYNELVPRDGELSITAMIEIDDKAERDAFLMKAIGIEKAFFVTVDGERFSGQVNPTRLLDDRASAVIYLKFALAPAAAAKLRAGNAKVAIGVEHAAYSAQSALPSDVAQAIAADLKEPS